MLFVVMVAIGIRKNLIKMKVNHVTYVPENLLTNLNHVPTPQHFNRRGPMDNGIENGRTKGKKKLVSLREQYIEKIKDLAEDFASITDLDQAEYEKKVRKLIYEMPLDDIGFSETIFLLCKEIRGELWNPSRQKNLKA